MYQAIFSSIVDQDWLKFLKRLKHLFLMFVLFNLFLPNGIVQHVYRNVPYWSIHRNCEIVWVILIPCAVTNITIISVWTTCQLDHWVEWSDMVWYRAIGVCCVTGMLLSLACIVQSWAIAFCAVQRPRGPIHCSFTGYLIHLSTCSRNSSCPADRTPQECDKILVCFAHFTFQPW